MKGEVLLLNPWLYDFAAFDLWSKPLGLLYISSWLKKLDFSVRSVDCLDRLHPESGSPKSSRGHRPGTGRWHRETVPCPAALKGIPRRFARYGLPIDVFINEITTGPRPDLILVASRMLRKGCASPGILSKTITITTPWRP